MRDNAILADLVGRLQRGLRRTVTDLSPVGLAWQPDPGANSVGVTVWHVARWLDILAVRILGGQPVESELWHTHGWAADTGYDPTGRGFRGLGAVTGYSLEEVAAIPALNAAQLLAYLDQAAEALIATLQQLPAGALAEPAPGLADGRSRYDRILPILVGGLGHLGEIQALAAMQTRQQTGAQTD